MYCSNDDDDDNKKDSFLLLSKKGNSDYHEKEELPIYNINNLTNDELKLLIQNFFDNDNYKNIYNFGFSQNSNNENRFYMFDFKFKKYTIILCGEKNNFKKMTIKFLNFLKNIEIEGFHCMPCEFDNDIDIIKLVGDIIKNSKTIKYITFPRSYLKTGALNILYDYIKDCEILKCLYLIHGPEDKLSNIYIGLLIDVIKSSTIEDIIGLNHNDYYIVFENLISNFFISKNPKMKYTMKCLNDYDIILKLSRIIKERNIDYLKEIDLSSNKITSKGFSILVDSLLKSNNKDIIKINMKSNKLDDGCIEKLGELIKKNENIECINLSRNNITDKGVEKLREYIVGNAFIESIDLGYNSGITEISFEIIKNMINSSEISSFKIHGTQISEKLESEIKELLKIPIEKREIPLITIEDVKSASKKMKEET